MKQQVWDSHIVDKNGVPTGGTSWATGIAIKWQDGALGTGVDRQTPNGAFVEGVIEVAIRRLEFFQTASDGKFSCVENHRAIASLKDALSALEERTKNREQRAVEGTHTP